MTFKPILCFAVAALVWQSASADSYQPSPSCTKPYKPYQFNSKWELDSFNADVERYKRCIKSFVDEQRSAIDVHRAAADEAIEQWNRYVRNELN